ncbi:acylneuraminate cytidylyltransferase [Clostridium tyrobutyricum]|uniref:acylneuraminate cytidylyltransferase n=1 Tax=Clostridium tyrobutyricum TaxID=1519 RepID=UPI001C391D5C|nr:acylneuraminate cytidylyltransferase [Clostridium tyrobutyricum]MBV4428317.1 acylneuraminate cytidylyltransferase [Clostridium tyrobutyricum]MBV4443307.1 acylneuraminate cytidylyltransferase [Clostridium tyrobutyricum]
MCELNKTIAIIPARGGSKSIPLKNIKLMNGRPLIYWVLDAAVACEKIDKIYVSTDSLNIKNVVKKYDNESVIAIDRSGENSTDFSTTESVMMEFAEQYNFENIVLIQVTSPLLEGKDLDEGLKKYFNEELDSVISVVRQKRFIWKDSNLITEPLNYDPNFRPMRQQFNGYLVENGAFYITSKDNLLKSKCRISGKIGFVEMHEETYFEIDEISDWIIVENLLKKRYNKKNSQFREKAKKIKAVFMDCDGVLTDGGMYYSEKGDELKKFNTRDGMSIQLLKEKGYIVGIITGEKCELVSRRAEKLNIDELYMGIKDKISVINLILKKYNLSYDEIAYIGDDINDVEIIKKVGLGCCVRDGMKIVQDSSDYITKKNGGHGAVREIVEMILNGVLI